MFLTETAVKRPIGTLMAVLAACLGGVLSFFFLPVDLMPNVESSVVTIFVNVRGGMPPEDIENLVTEPIEEAVSTMAGLKEVVSVSKKDRATVTLEFDETQNAHRASMEVSERLARVKGKLPKEIEKPIVARYNENDHPVVILSATSSAKSPEIIRTMVEKDLKPTLSRVNGVANVEISGGRQRKILVEFEKSKLEMHRLNILDVIRELGASNVSMASGKYETGRDARSVHIDADFASLEEMKQLPVAMTREGSRIRLGDVAVVRDYYLEPESYSRVNNQPTVSVYVQKESGANTIRVAQNVIKAVNEYQRTLPQDMGVGVSVDQSVEIRQSIADVREALFLGAVLTGIILWFFLKRAQQVRVVVISIPVAVIVTFFLMLLQRTLLEKLGSSGGITINVMSLLGIALGIGRIVDDSIVVFENIIHKREALLRSSSPVQGEVGRRPGGGPHPTLPLAGGGMVKLVIEATGEMAMAVASSTIILVVIFLPIIFFSADVRAQFSDMAFTVIASLMVSLFVAITVVPLLCVVTHLDGEYKWEKRFIAWLESKFMARKWPRMGLWGYGWLVAFIVLIHVMTKFVLKEAMPISLELFFLTLLFLPLFLVLLRGEFKRFVIHGTAWAIRQRRRVMWAVGASILVSGAIYLFALEKEFIGETEQKEFVIFVELDAGTKLDISDKIVAAVEKEINETKEIASSVKTVSARVEGWSSKIYVTLVPKAERTKSTQDVIDDLRPRITGIGGEYKAFIYFSEPSRSKEFVIDCYGSDYLVLRDMAANLATKMEEIKGFRDVKLRYKPGRPELRLAVDTERASLFGLSARDIADSLHAQIRGLRATYFNTGDDQVETVARLSEEDRRTREQVSNLSIQARDRQKTLVPVQQVIDFKDGFTPSEVWRKNKERMIQVSANRERISLSAAVEQTQAKLRDYKVPVGYYYEIGGDYKKLVRSEREFLYAFIVMIMLVYMVLACFFESYSQPILMLLTLPLATAGSLPMLWMTNTTINMGVYMGLLMLGGTVTANGIILIDRLNVLRQKKGLVRSVLTVGYERSRPIFMTSLCTISGMLPLALKQGGSAETWVPFAVTVISGIAVSSVLSIFVIPAAYFTFVSASSPAVPGSAGSSH